MSNRGSGPYPPRVRFPAWERWQANPDNLQKLEDACAAQKVSFDKATRILEIIVRKAHDSGETSESTHQLSAATGGKVTDRTVQRILTAATAAGLLRTVRTAHGPGRGNSKGMPATRFLAFLEAVDTDENNCHLDTKQLPLSEKQLPPSGRPLILPLIQTPLTEPEAGCGLQTASTELEGGRDASKKGTQQDRWANAWAAQLSGQHQRWPDRPMRDEQAVVNARRVKVRDAAHRLLQECRPGGNLAECAPEQVLCTTPAHNQSDATELHNALSMVLVQVARGEQPSFYRISKLIGKRKQYCGSCDHGWVQVVTARGSDAMHPCKCNGGTADPTTNRQPTPPPIDARPDKVPLPRLPRIPQGQT